MTTMLPLLIALVPQAGAAQLDLSGAQSVVVSYTMTMSTKGVKVCETSYAGSGKVVAATADAATFEGSWKVAGNTCPDTVWVPDGGHAFHTLRRTGDGKKLEEWVVHGTVENSARRTSNQKASGQFWINELAASPGKDGSYAFTSTEDQGGMGITVQLAHDLKITVGAAATADVAPPDPNVPVTPVGQQ